MPARSGVFENQDVAIIERDFGGFPCWTLIEPVWVGFRWFPVGGRWVAAGTGLSEPGDNGGRWRGGVWAGGGIEDLFLFLGVQTYHARCI